ncbi:hypothetical protein P7I46_06235 [Enterococcus casseliflavus]|uniref:hypothetical protein n=1 Tax=Enterococcus casseliflavus TaxID=37734 RepID=UPI00288F0745|nr:hypothetical protein [Enterococcus casseliflavus]MDT2954231.1 hypothetical protein [Enterococcus casseliflavus]MDT2957501.1 hypothetical protein [Enterococcus casseliflavus]
MKFYEALLTVDVEPEFAEAYKKAIEGENDRYFTENPILDKEGKLISNDIKPVWSGNYVNVDYSFYESYSKAFNVKLDIAVVSRTQPNVEEFIKQYEREGATLVKKNF